jgi:hypothetical protein
LTPGLLNTSAMTSIAANVAHDLRAQVALVLSLPLYSDAALAFGCVVAAEVLRRRDGRVLYLSLIVASILVSVGSAIAPAFSALFAFHVAHGFLAGMLLITALPPTFVSFPKQRVPTTVLVLVPALFGASTLAPLAGALVARSDAWRALFWIEALVGVLAFALALHALRQRRPAAANAPIDFYAIGMSGLATILLYAGAGNLATHDWTYLAAAIPFAAGLAAIVALLVGEALRKAPLLPVKSMLRALPVIGLVATASGGAIFAANQQTALLLFANVARLDPVRAGIALSPEFALAVVGGLLFAIGLRTRWLPAFTFAGLLALGVGTVMLHLALREHPGSGQIAAAMAVAALGAGLTVTPGLFIAALSVERAFVGGAIATLQLLRLTFSFVTAPGVEHTVLVHGTSPVALLRFIQSPQSIAPSNIPALRADLLAGMSAANGFVIAGTVLALLFVLVMFVRYGAFPRKPDLEAFLDRGEPAFETPRL